MASTNRNVTMDRRAEDTAEDLMASASSLWLPRTVVRRHRKKATLIWIFLLAAFSVYVGYVVWDTVDARRSPAASIQLKQSPFKFPDVAVCASFLHGCLSETEYCLQDQTFKLISQSGFMEDDDYFDPADYPDVTKVQAEFPHCLVMPLSRLTVNETGVNNGDITSFSASLLILWLDDPDGDFNSTENQIFTQLMNAHFIDIEKDVEEIGEKTVDVQLPYERIDAIKGEPFTSTRNHMVISMSEFSGITETGRRQEREQTFSQTTTSGKDEWYWTDDTFDQTISILQLNMLIKSFEYTSVQEVDPVDPWAIIGAIGGVWQFVVVAFGVFFIFSEKQAPDKKMRNFRDTIIAPATTINKRLSSITSSRSSQQDIELDATEEDLPPGWVKRQRKSGSVYYFNVMTGSTRVDAPHERDESSESTRPTVAPRRQNGIRSLFRVAPSSQGSGLGGSQQATRGTNDGGSLPPGWLQRTDGDGKVYYMDTVRKTTQWHRPVWRVHSTSGSGVQAVDTPMRHTRRASRTGPSQVSAAAVVIPPTTAAVTREVVDEPLPPCWDTRVTLDGRTYYSNSATEKTQWAPPL